MLSVRTEAVQARAETGNGQQRDARLADSRWVFCMTTIPELRQDLAILSLSDGVTCHMVTAFGVEQGNDDYLVIFHDPWGPELRIVPPGGEECCRLRRRTPRRTVDGKCPQANSGEFSTTSRLCFPGRKVRVTMSLSIQPLRRDDGVHALVEGFGGTFRFRLGLGRISVINHPSAYLWSVDGSVGHYLLQVVPHNLTVTPGAKPIEVLASHFRWEMDFMRERLGVTVEEPRSQCAQPPLGIADVGMAHAESEWQQFRFGSGRQGDSVRGTCHAATRERSRAAFLCDWHGPFVERRRSSDPGSEGQPFLFPTR